MLNVKNRIPENDNDDDDDDDDIDDDADVDDDDGDDDGDDCDDIVRKPKTYDRSGRLCDFFGALFVECENEGGGGVALS